MSSNSIENDSMDFEITNHELRAHWQMGREAARNVGEKINELVSILYKEHNDWNVKKIAYTIAQKNDDLEGFSYKTIYSYLDNDHKALLDPAKQNREKSQNNVLEESDYDRKHKVIEESSSRTLPTAYDVKEAETVQEEEEEEKYRPNSALEKFRQEHGTTVQEEEEQEEIFDKAFVDRLIKENAELVTQFSFDYDLEVKDQVLPLKVIVYPDKKTGVVRLRKK